MGAASKKNLPKELEGVATSDDLSKLTDRVAKLEKRVGDHASLAMSFKEAMVL